MKSCSKCVFLLTCLGMMGCGRGDTAGDREITTDGKGLIVVGDLVLSPESENQGRAALLPTKPEVFDAMSRAVEYGRSRLGGSIVDVDGKPVKVAVLRQRIVEVTERLRSAGFEPGGECDAATLLKYRGCSTIPAGLRVEFGQIVCKFEPHQNMLMFVKFTQDILCKYVTSI